MRSGPATASTATGSGGATAAPRAIAALRPRPRGPAQTTVPATAATVASTRPTASSAIVRQRVRNSAHEARWAVA